MILLQTITKYSFEYRHAYIIVLGQVFVNTKSTYLSNFGAFNKRGGTFMGSLYKRIVALCDSRGIKGGKMCTDIGISKGLLTDLKMGRRTGVSAVTAQKIASYFNVSVGYLLGEEDEKKEQPTEFDGLSDKRKALIDFAMSVPDDKAEMILRVMKSIVEGDE